MSNKFTTEMRLDMERWSTTVDCVEPCRDGWSVRGSDGWSLFVTSERCAVAPSTGEEFVMFGRGIGYIVRGIAIGGRVYRYESAEESELSRQREAEEAKRNRASDYKAKLPEYEAKLAALPFPMRDRVNRFRRIGGMEWRYQFEPYELFCCEQAVTMARELKTVDALRTFAGLTWEEQSKLDWFSQEHSGNTFNCAVGLARCLLEDISLVPKAHGALCPLVGCKEYHCFAAHAGTQ